MDPQKKVLSILKNIEDGKANEANTDHLTELLDIQPSIVPEVMQTLNVILQKGNAKAFSSAIQAIDKITENNPGLEDYSLKVIVNCMQKRKEDLHEENILNILEILIKITQNYSERMGATVPELLVCLKNSSIKVREKAYFLLALLAITHHEFFTGRSKDIIRVLNGLNLDERIKACRLIRKIAVKDRAIMVDTYDVLEDLRLNHPDSNLRSEAAFAMDKLQEPAGKNPSGPDSVKPVPVADPLITDEAEVPDESTSEFTDLIAPNEEDLKEALEAMGLKYLVTKKDAVEKRDVPKSFEVIPDTGNVTVLQNENKEMDRTKSEFFVIASHDLRTPLNSVIGFSELLKQGTAGRLSDKQERYVNNVLSSGKELLDLINDIIEVSMADAGKTDLVIEKVSVQATIDEILFLIKETATKNNIVLKIGLDPALEFIEADKQRFEQVLLNLLSNAIKFSKTNGATITITTKREDDMAKFSVTDTGIGIKERDMGKLFKEFVQLDESVSRKYRGSGLGLAISKKVVEMHRGKIWAESKYGEGSTFSFLLPIQAKRQELPNC